MTKYVTDPVKIKLLLSKCPILETMLVNLIIELQVIYKQGTGFICSSDEIMEAMANGTKPLSDMPRSTSGSSEKMTDIVTGYQKILDAEYGELLKVVRDDIFMLNAVIEKINNAVERLPIEQREVLRLKYWQKRSWKQIADALRISKRQVEELHKAVVSDQICKVLQISFDAYDYVMEKVR